LKNTVSTLLVALILSACTTSQKSDVIEIKKNKGKKEIIFPAKDSSMIAKSNTIIKCSIEKDQRSMEVKPLDKGCTLFYLKQGETKAVASSRYGIDHCQKVQSKIKSRLEKAGFKCE